MFLNGFLIYFEKNLMFYDKKVLTNVKCCVIVAIVIGAQRLSKLKQNKKHKTIYFTFWR